jgi:hypothetical protein
VWVELDLAKVQQAGWVRLGSVALEGSVVSEPVRLIATEQDAERFTWAGPIMLVLNRRSSPDVAW